MDNNTKELVLLLKEYESASDASTALCDNISNTACDILINDNGCINYNRVFMLRDAGYYIYPGEQDNFGWLIGVIVTKKGNIMFG